MFRIETKKKTVKYFSRKTTGIWKKGEGNKQDTANVSGSVTLLGGNKSWVLGKFR